MQVLEGGKDNPGFDGQKMFQKLDGTFVPAKEITLANIPENISPEMKERLTKINEIVKSLDDLGVTFMLTVATHNKDAKENDPTSIGLIRWSGAPGDIGFIFHELLEEMHRTKLIHKISGIE